MAFYEDRGKRPRRKDSVGPEEGYRPRGARGQKPEKREAAPGAGRKPQGRYAPPDRKPYDPQRPRPARPQAPRPQSQPVVDTWQAEGEEAMPRENLLVGRNPIREAVKSGRDIERLLVAKGELSGSAREIVALAKERHIVVQVVDRARLDEITGSHQGMIAFASAFRYSTVEDMLALAKERGEDPLLVVLDGITDPHNLGAIIRSAECAGAHGVIVPERRAVGLTPAAVKSSAGAVEYLPVARVGNLTRFLGDMKKEGLWVVAADMEGEPYTQADLTGGCVLVIGGEGSGVSRLVLENSDRRVSLPLLGKIDSLNASVAAGVLLYEIRRQRG